jgi:hypothetical protein
MRWEAVYLERRARDSRRYDHTFREEVYAESGAVEPEALLPPRAPKGEPSSLAQAAPETPKRKSKQQQTYTRREELKEMASRMALGRDRKPSKPLRGKK